MTPRGHRELIDMGLGGPETITSDGIAMSSGAGPAGMVLATYGRPIVSRSTDRNAPGPGRMTQQDGFALPLTIFLVSLLTVLLAAAFTRVQADRRLADSSGAATLALNTAHAGLESYLGSAATAPADGDSTRVNVAGGFADVVAHVLQASGPATSTQTYVLRSTGSVIQPTLGADPQAVRTIAQFARWQTATVNVLAPFTAINLLNRVAGGAGEFRGIDPCSGDSLPAIRVPTGGNPDVSGYTVDGSIPIVVEQDTPSIVANLTGINWNSVLSIGIKPDHDSIVLGDFSYPITRVLGDATIAASGSNVYGTGLLIVSGDLTTAGSPRVCWDGIILVGGTIHFNADQTYFDGVVVSGLNTLLGGPAPPTGTIGGSHQDIDYDQCVIDASLAALTGFRRVPIWVDNWATY